MVRFMITGGTSPFPGWAIWLFLAITVTIVTCIVCLVVWRTSGFRNRSVRHLLLAVLVIATASCWTIYRIESNQRWAARAVANEVADLLVDGHWTERQDTDVRTSKTEGCAQDNGAVATIRLRSLDDLPRLRDMPSEQFEEFIREYEWVAQRMIDGGFDVDRGLETPTGVNFVITASRGDQVAKLLGTPRSISITAAANECNSQGIRNGIIPPDRIVGLDSYTAESVCAIERTPAVLACAPAVN